jgi:hypothetical protein
LRLASELVLESVSPQNSKKPWQRLRLDKVSESINKESSSNVGEDRSLRARRCYKFGPFWQAKSCSIC